MRIYIAGHDQGEALRAAAALDGHTITSTWIFDTAYRTRRTEEEKQTVAERDVGEVLQSDLLVSLSADDNVPGGKHVELGAALGAGIRCLHVGRIENIFHFHPLVTIVDAADELTKRVGEWEVHSARDTEDLT